MVAQDKVNHWAFGFVLSFMGILWFPLILLGYAFAFGKEGYDHYYGNGWSHEDVQATVVGALMAWALILVVNP